MKRLAVGFGIAGGVALLVAFVSGFVPVTVRDCTGSFFEPMRGPGWDSDGPSISLASLCNANGYPGVFWTFMMLGVALVIAAIVFQQVGAHRVTAPPRVARPPRTVVAVASTVPPTPGSLAFELKSLKDLYDVGGLTADEFAAAKARVLRTPPTT